MCSVTAGQGRQQRERLERCHRMAALQRLDRHVEHRQMVGHEEGVEPPALQRPGEALQMREIEVGVREGARIAPGAGMNADRPHERAKPQLPCSARHQLLQTAQRSCCSLTCTARLSDHVEPTSDVEPAEVGGPRAVARTQQHRRGCGFDHRRPLDRLVRCECIECVDRHLAPSVRGRSGARRSAAPGAGPAGRAPAAGPAARRSPPPAR